ncbi:MULTISPECIES: 2-hydroxyacid dehydrogenase [unclassified Janibacter]|uniref:2-hydroxyacid dehydrogenase n=1 Tax=unclassified Janibacter TaxID=2649294 RepID=UPI003D056E93
MSRAGRDTVPADHRRRLEERGASVHYETRTQAPDLEEAARLLEDVEVLGTTNVTLPHLGPALLARCPRLRSLVLYATGLDHLDHEALRAHGVTVSSLPAYATRAVAEHALAMTLSMGARVHLAHDRSRGLAAPDTSLRGIELGGRTMGIIGMGRIGTALAGLATGIGMRVVGTDIDPRAVAAATRAGHAMVPPEDLHAASDIVAVCASTTAGAPPVIDAAALAALRPQALLVNVGRPVLVDTAAVTGAIRTGHLRGYAVDDVVLDPALDGDLLSEGRVLQTGHSAWWRDEVLARGADMFGEALVEAVERASAVAGVERVA